MAINADKLLNKSSGRLAMQKAQQEKMIGGGPSNIVLSKKSIKGIESIKINVIKIEDILKGSLALDKKQLDDKKKATSGKRRENIETKLETKPNVESGKVKMPSAPRMGILDFIKNFIGNVLLGYFAVRLIKHLPKIMPIVKFLGNAADFIINTGGFLLNGLATFLDIGYKAYDATRGFLKSFGGENFAKGFDKFIGAIDTALFLTTVLAGSMAMEAMSGGGGGGPGGPGPRRQPTRTTSGGRTLDTPNIRNPVRQKPTVTTGGATPRPMGGGPKITGDVSGGGKLKLPSKSGIRAGGIAALVMLIPDLINSGMLISQGRPKDGIRTLLSAIAGVGAGMAAIAGVTAGAAALGITGVGIPAAIALAIAGFAASSAASFLAYEGTDALLKKMGLIDNDPKTGKPYAYRSGGVTRGGKSRGRVKRTLSKGKYKRVLAPQKPSKTEFKDKEVKKSTEELDKTKYFGPILAISSKIMNKEEPTDRDYQNVGLGINLLIAKGIQDGQLKGGIVAKFAGGGLVDPDVLSAAETGGDISNWVAKAFRGAIETGAQKTMRLMKEMREKNKPAGVPGSEQPGDPSMVNIQGGSADFWTLVAIASREDADPQGSADVAQSIYNRLASGAYTGKTIKDLITAGGQYEPTWQYPKGSANVKNKPNPEWFAIKDAASAAAASGMSEEAMKSVASSILNPTLQENARQFVQGRTDFKGANSGRPPSIQRKGGDNWFGWEYNYRANKIGSIPNFGATATSTPGGPGPSIALGAGYGSGGSKIAGELGDYMKQVKIPTGEIHQHPRHPGLSKRSYFSYHNQGRAIDLGGYGPAHPSSGGRDEQAPILRALVAWNKQKGVTPVEVIHGSSAFRGFGKYESAPNALHSHHVHVAYAKGGRIYKLTRAILGEKGQEFVFDYDTTRGLDSLAPLLLDKLNTAKTKPQLANILQSYADYERPYPESQDRIVEVPVLLPPPLPPSEQVLVAVGSGRGGGNGSSYTDGLYAGSC
jgi:hypothetical protein